MSNNCPKCGHINRDVARFCAQCGATLTPPAPSVSAAEVAEKAKEMAAKVGAAVGPAAAKAGAAVAPVAKEAVVKGWAGSKRGMSFFARVVTVGGRAAYSEVFSPFPIARGQVATPPAESTVPVPVEPAAILFVISLLAGWLIFALPGLSRGISIAVIFAALLVLSWMGVRRPYFTRMTFSGLLARLRRRGQAPRVPIYKFRISEGIRVGRWMWSWSGNAREGPSLREPWWSFGASAIPCETSCEPGRSRQWTPRGSQWRD